MTHSGPAAPEGAPTGKLLPSALLPQILLLLLVCAPLFFVRLGVPGLGDPDEGRNAEVPREMVATGDFITPRLDGVVYLDKPPAFFWTVALSYMILGVSELSARAPSAIFALAAIVLVFCVTKRPLGSPAAWFAALTLALSPLFIVFGRIVIFDMMLTFCMTVAALSAFRALESEPPRRVHGILFFAAAGLGTICKGPVALVVPLLVAVVWALLRRKPRELRRLRFGLGALVYVAIIAPWLVLVESRHPGYLHYAIVGENLERMTSNRFETARPFFFYAKVVLPGLFPWIVLCALAAWRKATRTPSWRDAWSRLESETDPGRLLVGYAGSWLSVLLLFFSLIASKRPSYMLPCAVPLAILSGRLWGRGFEERDDSKGERGPLEIGLIWISVLCAGGGLAALLVGPGGMALGMSQGKYDALFSRHLLFSGTALGLLAAAVLLLVVRRLRRPALAFAASFLPIAVLVPLSHAANGYLDQARSSRPVSRFLAQHLTPDDIVVCYEQYHPGLNFYLRRPVHLVTSGTPFSSWYIKAHLDELRRDPGVPVISGEQMRGLLEAPTPDVFVVAPRRMYDRLRAQAGEGLHPEPIYEDPGNGVFVRAPAGSAPTALGVGPPRVLSFPPHPGARLDGPG